MKRQRNFTTRDIIFIGVFSALCVIATTVKIPLVTGGMVHLGTACLFTIAILFGGVYAGLSGAIGSAFFDLLMGFSPYTIWSFVIKGIAGFIAGVVVKGLWPETTIGQRPVTNKVWMVKAIFGCLLAALWTLGGYILAWWQVTGSLSVAIGNMPSSLITSGVGMIVAFFLTVKLHNVIKM
jgi:uncharacterized membrane protein